MIRKIACPMAAFFVISLFLFQAVCVFAQNRNSSADWGDALVKWDTTCFEKGCLMQTDVLRGDSGDPPDPKDFREYIGIEVALYRKSQKPGYISFLVDPRAQRDQGIFITFTHTSQENGHWKLDLDPEGPSRLAFTDCNDEACTARVPFGLVEDGLESHKMDLLERFLHSDHLLVLYVKDGKAYRTMIMLSSFKKEYERIMATELSKPLGSQ